MDHNDFPRTDSAAQLTDAFRIFNELSQNLTASYLALQDQVAKLRRELAASRDERLKALIEKEKLANRLQLILTALPAGVMLVDRSGTVIDCNALARQFLGEPLVGRSWGEIASQRLSAVDGNPHQRLLANGDCVSVTVKTLGEEGGQIVLLSDVSEMRVLQRAVEQRKHLTAMGEMVAGMAHQVRTPLSTAILYASQLEKPGLKEAKRRLFAEKISERLRHLERQVNDMMVFAREGRMSMNMFSPSHLLSKL
ncbi:MAG: histidine kinase dimerization/phospho-acceptor domain-containing protein, partial [Gammaproteobacteria bacterium]